MGPNLPIDEAAPRLCNDGNLRNKQIHHGVLPKQMADTPSNHISEDRGRYLCHTYSSIAQNITDKSLVSNFGKFVQERCARKWVQDAGYHLGRWKDLPIYISHYQESKQFKALAQLLLFGDWRCYLNYQQQHLLFSKQTITACHGSHRIQSSSTRIVDTCLSQSFSSLCGGCTG